VQTETAERGLTLTTQVVTDVPNVNRSWDELLGNAPRREWRRRCKCHRTNHRGERPDGVSVQLANRWWALRCSGVTEPGHPATPVGHIQEVDLSTANFGAERGSGLSVFNVTTKSGTNQFHGTRSNTWEHKFDARNYFADPPNRNQQFDGTNSVSHSVGPSSATRPSSSAVSGQSHSTPSTAFYSYPSSKMRTGDFSELCQPALMPMVYASPLRKARVSPPSNSMTRHL